MTFPVSGASLQLDHRVGVYSDDSKTTPATAGGVVACWEDQSGNGYDFAQTSNGLRPLLQTAGITFDGSDDYLQNQSPTLAALLNAAQWSIWIAYKLPTYSANSYIYSAASGTTNNPSISEYSPSSPRLSGFLRNAAGSQPGNSGDLSTGFGTGVYRYGGMCRSVDGDVRLYADGTLQNELDRSTLSGSLGIEQFTLGANGRVSVSNNAHCVVEYLGVWDTTLTAGQYGTLSDWAKSQRYGGSTAAGFPLSRLVN